MMDRNSATTQRIRRAPGHSWRRGVVAAGILMAALNGEAQCITAYPHLEDFEGAPVWSVNGVSPDWAWGTPAHPLINSAGGGVNSWCVGGLSGSFYNLGQLSWIESGCYDMTTLDHPWIGFKIFWETERDYDGLNLQYSINGGSTWANVGAFGDPVDCLNDNWYNNTNVLNLTLASPKHGWSGRVGATAGSCIGGMGSGAWIEAKHCLPAACANQPDVRFRFLFGAGTTCNDYDGVAVDDVLVRNAPPATAAIAFSCTGTTVDFQISTTSCPSSFAWDFGDPASGAANASTQAAPSHVFTAPGSYPVTLTVTGPCSDPFSTSVVVGIPEVAISVVDPPCADSTGSMTAVVTGTSAPVGFAWSPGGANTATIAGIAPGAYSVTVSGAGVCTTSANAILTAPAPLAVLAMNDTMICDGAALMLAAASGGGTGVITLAWSPAGPLLSPAQPGAYSVIATDANGCTSPPDTVSIGVLPPVIPQFASSDPEGCAPWCVTFTELSATGTNAWDFGDGATAANNASPQHCYGNEGWFSVTLTITDANGCTGTTVVDSAVHAWPAPEAAFIADPPVARIEDPVVHFLDASSGATQWWWDFGDPAGTVDAASSPSFTFPDVGCYTVTQVVGTDQGCSDTASALVCVEDEFALYAPNAFTPDGDGINDAWLPVTTVHFPPEFELHVFDRWGAEIFASRDHDRAWDGRIGGGEAPIGAYAWRLRLRDMLQQRHEAAGHVVLIR